MAAAGWWLGDLRRADNGLAMSQVQMFHSLFSFESFILIAARLGQKLRQ